MTPWPETVPDEKVEGAKRKNTWQAEESQMLWAKIKTDGSNWDESYARYLTSRLKHVRIQGRTPRKGLCKDGLLKIRDINTAWNNAEKGD